MQIEYPFDGFLPPDFLKTLHAQNARNEKLGRPTKKIPEWHKFLDDEHEEVSRMWFSKLMSNWIDGIVWSKAIWRAAFDVATEQGFTLKTFREKLRAEGMLQRGKYYAVMVDERLSIREFKKFDAFVVPLFIRVLSIHPNELYRRISAKETELKKRIYDVLEGSFIPKTSIEKEDVEIFFTNVTEMSYLWYEEARVKAWEKWKYRNKRAYTRSALKPINILSFDEPDFYDDDDD